MKTLGMIGGLGPESTIEYYRTIIALYREKTKDESYPQFLINNLNLKRLVDFVTASDWAGATQYLVSGIEKLAQAGADFGIITANTPHVVFEEVQAASPIPLISIVEATCVAAQGRGLKRLALFGTRFTMREVSIRRFSRAGLELVLPEPNEQEFIHDKYMNELVKGNFLPETRARLLEIVDRMREGSRIDSIILAGTELPLILRDSVHNGTPLLDTMRVHVEAAVDRMLS